MNIPNLIYASDRQQNLRVVHQLPGTVFLMPIGAKNEWTFSKTSDYVREMLKRKKWLDLTSDYPSCSSDTDVVVTGQGSSYSRAVGDKRFQKYGRVLQDVTRLLTRAGRGQAYREMRELEPHFSKETFYKVLRDWLEGGTTVASLDIRRHASTKALDTSGILSLDFEECKRQTQAKARELQLLGAPDATPKTETATGKFRKRASPHSPSRFIVDRPCLRIFKHYYKRKFAIPTPSLESLYHLMLVEVFSTPQPFGPPLMWPQWCLPSLSRFREYWVKMHSFKERQIAQGGPHNFELNQRGDLGQQITEAYAAGRVGEIDATVWGVNLVSDEEGAPLIGPPVVFRLRCKDTGQLLGISVSLENASFNSAAMCIANCMDDKEEFCRRHGVEDTGLPWKARGLPAEIVADQGETYNNKPIPFSRFTGVAITSLPRARGDMKGGIESGFHVIHTKLVDLTPSAIVKRYVNQENIDWKIRGSMTLGRFMQVLLHQELQTMHEPRRGVRRTLRMRRQGVNSSPTSMFQWSLAYGGGMLRTFDPNLVRLSLLPREKASVDERGLVFRGVIYQCRELKLSEASSRARVKGVARTAVVYDPLRVKNIWLVVGDTELPDKYVLATVDERFVAQRDIGEKTWREVLADMQDDSRVNTLAEAALAANLARSRAEQQRIVKEGEEWTAEQRKGHPQTKTAMRNGGPAARLRAKNKSSPMDALSSSIEHTSSDELGTTQPEPASAVVYQLQLPHAVHQIKSDTRPEAERPRPPISAEVTSNPPKRTSRFLALLDVCQPDQVESASRSSS